MWMIIDRKVTESKNAGKYVMWNITEENWEWGSLIIFGQGRKVGKAEDNCQLYLDRAFILYSP